MAQPITWRNIAGPNFDNSALGQGINAFRSAGEGLSRFGSELLEAQQLADAQYTNQTVADALRTGRVDPNLNPRADSARVHDALLGLQTGRSDLETARVARAATRADTLLTGQQTEELKYKNTDAYRKFETDYKQAEIDRARAQTGVERRNADLRLQELKLDKARYDREIKTAQGTDRLNSELFNITERFANEIIDKEYSAKGEVPSEDDINSIWQRSVAKAEGPEGLRLLQSIAKELPSESWAGSRIGQLEATADASAAALAQDRAKRYEIARETGQEAQVRMLDGDYSMATWDGQNIVPLEDPDAVKRLTLKSDREARASLIASGVPADKFSDDEKEVLGVVRDLFPISSAYTAIVKSFYKNGKLDEKGLREASGDAATLIREAQRRSNATQYILQDPDDPRTQVRNAVTGANQGRVGPRSIGQALYDSLTQ